MTEFTDKDIPIHHILAVDGFIHIFCDTSITIQHIPGLIRHEILFFYAKPIIINIKYHYDIKYILFDPLHGTWYNIADKIHKTFNILFVESLVYGNNANLTSQNWNKSVWNDTDLFIPLLLLDEYDSFKQRITMELDNISPQTFEKLLAKILAIASDFVDTEEKYVILLSSILRKASEKSELSKQYVDLCCDLRQNFATVCENFVWLNIEQTKCWRLFKKMIIRASERVFTEYRSSSPIISQKQRETFIDVVRIIGQLYNKDLLHSNIIIKGILKTLLPPENKNPTAIEIEAACISLKVCGKQLDKNDKKHQILSNYIQIIKDYCAVVFVEKRIKDMVDEVENLKNNFWHS